MTQPRSDSRTRGRRGRILMLAAAAVLALAATACDPVEATDYVALGDSYTAGPLIPTQRDDPPGCLRSNANYPSLVAPSLKPGEFRDASCSGATTDDLFEAQDPYFGPENPPQLDALDDDTGTVTLGIGGNDIGFTDIVINCATQNPLGQGCKADYTAGGGDDISDEIDAAAPKVDAALDAIADRAPNADIYVVGYPAILPDTGNGCYPVVPLLPQDVPYLRAKEKELNAMLAQRATTAGLDYIDTYTPSIGHDVCSGLNKWIEGVFPTGAAAPVHPNAKGMRGLADIVTTAVNPAVNA